MKARFVLATATAVMLSASAIAAELPLKARPPAPAPAPTWNSCYLGINGGWAGARSEFNWVANNSDGAFTAVATNPSLFGTGSLQTAINLQEVAVLNSLGTNTLTTSGGTGGGEWGCNWQFNSVVFGYEGDLEWTGINTSLTGFFPGAFTGFSVFPVGPLNLVPQAFTESVTSRWLSTARFRAGWSGGPWLLYATGGIAIARVTFTDTVALLNPAFLITAQSSGPAATANAVSTTDTKVGWTVGGGFEWLIWGNWSVKAEYLYVDLGRVTNVSFNSGVFNPVFGPQGLATAAFITHNHNLHEQIARVGLNYQLNWGAAGPVAARY